MKQFIVFLILVLAMPTISALDYPQAIEHGEAIIRQNAKVGHQGMLVEDYSVKAVKMYENELYYRIIYEIKGNILGIERERIIMLEMDKDSGVLQRIYIMKKSATTSDGIL